MYLIYGFIFENAGIAITTIGNSPKKIPTIFFISNNKKMWIEMFFIKFEGKIENIRGITESIFNFTQEFNEKH